MPPTIEHYMRVSTTYQRTDFATQQIRLEAAPCPDNVHSEIRARDQPQNSILHDIIPTLDCGSQIWTTHISRYGTGSRLQELISLARIHEVELHCLGGTITELTADDIGTRIAIAVLLEIGQDDLNEHRARIAAGRERARDEGRSLGGRPLIATDARIGAWKIMHDGGMSYQQIADNVGVSKSTIKRGLKKLRSN